MKTPPAHESPCPPKAPRKPSSISRLSAWLTGTDSDAIAFAPNYELRKLHKAALSLVLVTTISMLCSAVAIAVMRGGFRPEQLPFSVIIGLVIYVLDRAFLRRDWEDTGLEAEGRVLVKRRRWPFWVLRSSVSLVLATASASFLELVIFEQDTADYIAGKNREKNLPEYDAIAAQVDAEIEAKRNDIKRLDDEAGEIKNTALTARDAQIGPLVKEREMLLKDQNTLEKKLAEQKQNLSAERTGNLRHDGSQAVPGEGRRYAHARNMVNDLEAQLAVVTARLGKIDSDLARLRQNDAPTGLPVEVQARLDDNGTRRATLVKELALMETGRIDTINSRLRGNRAKYVERPDGLFVRGDAVSALADKSAWLATQLWLIRCALVVLDLCAILVISMVRAPKSIVVDEVRASDTAIKLSEARHKQACVAPEQSIAECEHQITKARGLILKESAQRAEDEDAHDEHKRYLETTKKSRWAKWASTEKAVEDLINDLKTTPQHDEAAGDENTGERP